MFALRRVFFGPNILNVGAPPRNYPIQWLSHWCFTAFLVHGIISLGLRVQFRRTCQVYNIIPICVYHTIPFCVYNIVPYRYRVSGGSNQLCFWYENIFFRQLFLLTPRALS